MVRQEAELVCLPSGSARWICRPPFELVPGVTVVRTLRGLELVSAMSSTGVWTLASGAPSSPVPSEEHVQLSISDGR